MSSERCRSLYAISFFAYVFFVIVALVSFFVWHGMGGVFKMSKYDHSKWLASPSYVSNEQATICLDRAEMAHDIVTSIIKPGMSRAEVIHFLGEPTKQKKLMMYYYLGVCRLMSIDYDYIDITIDSGSRVVRASIVNR